MTDHAIASNDSNINPPEIRTGGQILAECLVANGAKYGFGVPGESYLAVLDALYDLQHRFELMVTRNEGGAAYMAAAYGALTGEPGLCFTTRGPGATNASVGVHSAQQNSAPMILFVGQVGRSMLGREAFQEIDYQAFYGSIAKWVVQIEDASRIPELISRAFTTAMSGRAGPVVVALPEDVLTETTDAPPCSANYPSLPTVDDQTLVAIRDRLGRAKRPLIFMGGRDWSAQAQQDLQQFAESSGIPVVTAFRFNDLFDNHSSVYAGSAGVGMHAELQALIHDADVVLALGVRFGEISTLGYTLFNVPEAAQQIIHVHVSTDEIGKVYVPALAVHAAPSAVVAQLNNADSIEGDRAPWLERARKQFTDSLNCPRQPGDVDMGVISAHLREVLPDDAIITNGAGNFTAWPNRFLTYGPDARLLAPQNGTMGFGLPAAIAAKKVMPDRTVVCFAGDGDFQMNCQELGSAMQYDALPIVLIVNNGSYGTIRMHQESHYPDRTSATDIVNPDYVALGKAYGMHAEVVAQTDEFAAAFERAVKSETGAIIDIRINLESLTPGRSLTEIRNAAVARNRSR